MASTNRVSRERPQGYVDTSDLSNRGGRYGEQYAIPLHSPRHALADEGSYFVAVNATPGTGIAVTGTITTFTDSGTTCGNLFMKNTESKTASVPKRVYLDYIKLITVAGAATATTWMYAIVIDDNPVRLTSGGTALAPLNPNGDSSATSIVTGSFGALVIAAAMNRRLIARGNFKSTTPLPYDMFMLVSGGAPGASYSAADNVPGIFIDVCPPIILGPQQNLLLSMWGLASNEIATFEHEIAWFER